MFALCLICVCGCISEATEYVTDFVCLRPLLLLGTLYVIVTCPFLFMYSVGSLLGVMYTCMYPVRRFMCVVLLLSLIFSSLIHPTSHCSKLVYLWC